MNGWYELKKSTDDRFHFVLKARNSETIISSELYTTKSSALNGINSIQTNCTEDKNFERKDSSNGKPFFNLRAANHQVIGTSQMYSSTTSRDIGIESVKVNGLSTAIEDVADN